MSKYFKLLDGYCEKCNQFGYRVPENQFTLHYVKTFQTYDLYRKEQLQNGVNVIHDYFGCTLCNSEMKHPNFFKRLIGF